MNEQLVEDALLSEQSHLKHWDLVFHDTIIWGIVKVIACRRHGTILLLERVLNY